MIDSSTITTWIVVFLVGYFLPTIAANVRRIKNTDGVLVVNLFLGWTLIGWVVALAWAVSGEKRPVKVRV